MTSPSTIPFTFALDQLGPAGVVALYTTLELGALYRLARFSWESDRPGELPDCDVQLALITQTRAEEWQAMRPRLLLSFRPEIPDGSGAPRLVNGTLRNLHASATARRNQLAAAGRASALARAGPNGHLNPTDVEHTLNTRSTSVEQPLKSGASMEARAHARTRVALLRKEIQINQERRGAPELPAETAEVEDVAGVILAGSEARAEARVTAWRSEESKRLIVAAFARWADQFGVTPGPDLPGRIARYGHVTPAMVEIGIGRTDGWLDSGRAAPRPGGGNRGGAASTVNPVGYLITVLGCRRGGGRALEPYAWDQPVVDKWAAMEKRIFDAEQALQAVHAGLMRIDHARRGTAAPPDQSAMYADRRAALKAAIERPMTKEIAS